MGVAVSANREAELEAQLDAANLTLSLRVTAMRAMRAELAACRAALEKCLSAFAVSTTPLPEDRQAVLEATAQARAALAEVSP